MTFTDNNYAPEDKIYECDGCGEETTEVNEIDGHVYCTDCIHHKKDPETDSDEEMELLSHLF